MKVKRRKNGKIAHRIEVPDETDPSGKTSEEEEEAPTSKKNVKTKIGKVFKEYGETTTSRKWVMA